MRVDGDDIAHAGVGHAVQQQIDDPAGNEHGDDGIHGRVGPFEYHGEGHHHRGVQGQADVAQLNVGVFFSQKAAQNVRSAACAAGSMAPPAGPF